MSFTGRLWWWLRRRGRGERRKFVHGWPGAQTIFFDGRLVLGPIASLPWLCCTYLLGLVPTIAFLSISAPDIDARIGAPVATVLVSLITIITLIALTAAASTEPGIFCRNFSVPWPNVDTDPPPECVDWTAPDGTALQLFYCDVCNLYKSVEVSHCTVCDSCIDRRDHHCPWIGTCVGRRNYGRFYMLLVCAFLLAATILILCADHLLDHDASKGSLYLSDLVTSMRDQPAIVVFACIALVLTCIFGHLVVYHTFLLFRNQTSREQVAEALGGNRDTLLREALHRIGSSRRGGWDVFARAWRERILAIPAPSRIPDLSMYVPEEDDENDNNSDNEGDLALEEELMKHPNRAPPACEVIQPPFTVVLLPRTAVPFAQQTTAASAAGTGTADENDDEVQLSIGGGGSSRLRNVGGGGGGGDAAGVVGVERSVRVQDLETDCW